MIYANHGDVIIKGNRAIVMAEMDTVIRNFKKMLEEKHGKEEAERLFNEILQTSKKSIEEIEKENEAARKQVSDLMKDVLETIMKGLGE